MTASIRNRNSRGEYHGYQQWHRLNTLAFRGTFKNNSSAGYTERHCYEIQTTYYIQ
jgi:hypothetical protein